MKLFELYNKRAPRNVKTFNASMQLCESVLNLLVGINEAGPSNWRAVSMFGDIAAGGGDPVDHLMIELGMDMDAINALAKEQGYDDAYDWADSYQMEEGMNDAGGFDFEPDPKFAGVKGITRDTGPGEFERKAAEKKKQNEKLNRTWQKLASNLGKMDGRQAEQLKMNMKKVASVAAKGGFTLSPPPEQILGL